MGSSGNEEDYRKSYRNVASSDEKSRKARVESTAYEVHKGEKKEEKKVRDVKELTKNARIADKITSPDAKANAIWVIGVDNSGSNRTIADHMKESSGYINGFLGMISPGDQICFIFFSDHCDGSHIFQDVDYLYPDKDGDAVMYATLDRVSPAGGGDFPEAIECLFKKASALNLGQPNQKKNFVLITDSVPHGLGKKIGMEDSGCPDQISWEYQLSSLRSKFDNFFVIACGDDENIESAQRQLMVGNEDERLNFISLINVKDADHRKKITPTAFIFLVARQQGLQNCELFLSVLYEKWMVNTTDFGTQAPQKAREAISRFGNYLDITDEEKQKFFKKVFAL